MREVPGASECAILEAMEKTQRVASGASPGGSRMSKNATEDRAVGPLKGVGQGNADPPAKWFNRQGTDEYLDVPVLDDGV